MNWMRLEHMSEFKYLGCVLDEEECRKKMAGRRKVVDAIRSLVIVRSLQIECTSLA